MSSATGSSPPARDPDADADADAPRHILEMFVSEPPDALYKVWLASSSGADAADSTERDPGRPLWPLCELAFSSDAFTTYSLPDVVAWECMLYPERPVVPITAQWSSPADLDAIVAALNACRPGELVLGITMDGDTCADGAVARIFDNLTAPLHNLALHDLDLRLVDTAPIAAYLASPRARTLQRLRLSESAWEHPLCAAPIVGAVADAGRVGDLVRGYYTEWEDPFRPPVRTADGAWFCPSPLVSRLPAVPWRNGQLVRALRRAAAQVLGPARIVLRAREGPAASGPAFPILDLPLHVLVNVLRYTADDPTALSDSQLARLLAHAGSLTALSALAAAVADVQHPRKFGGELVSREAYAALLADANNPGEYLAQCEANRELEMIRAPTFAEAMDRWLAAGGFHV